MVCFGSCWDCSSLKTLLCLAYSGGIFVLSISWAVPIVALQSSMHSIGAGRGLFTVRGMNRALAASAVLVNPAPFPIDLGLYCCKPGVA